MTHAPAPRQTRVGLDQNLEGALCYVLGLASGVVFLLIEPENRYVRFHAYQSIFTFAAAAVVRLLISGLPLVSGTLFLFAVAGLWVFLMYKALNGDRYKLPFLGDWAEQQVK